MIVRPETPSDYEAIEGLLGSAFEGEDESHLVRSLRASGTHGHSGIRDCLGSSEDCHALLTGPRTTYNRNCTQAVRPPGLSRRIRHVFRTRVLCAPKGIGSTVMPTAVEGADDSPIQPAAWACEPVDRAALVRILAAETLTV
jgi:hypothetical protein